MLATQPHLSHPKYRPDIDGLRAVAVLAVVAFHAFPNWIKGGFIGVDVFFVISGYLISTIIFENFDTRTFRFTAFYARRIRRIFPALILVLIASYFFGWFALLADEYRQLGKHIAGGAAFISNIILWNESGYFDNTADSKPLLHLWSLGVEEQFYIIWPLLLWFGYKITFNLLGVGILVALISFYLNIKQVNTNVVADFYSPQTRFWELMSGSILAWIAVNKTTIAVLANNNFNKSLAITLCLDRIKHHASTLLHLISASGFLFLAYGFLKINTAIGFPGKWALIPVLGTVLIIYAGPKAWLNRFILSNKVVVWFGLISFPLYLWHWPLLSFAHIVVSDRPSRNVRGAAVVVSILLSWLTYKYVERPLRFGKNNGLKVICLSGFMATVCLCGLLAYIKNGFPLRSSLNGLDNIFVNSLAEDEEVFHKECLSKYGLINEDIRFCRTTKNLTPRIAIIGDSHGAALFKALSEELEAENEGLLMIGGRLFTSIATYPDGNEREIQIYKGGMRATEFVAHEKSLSTVIVVSGGPFYLYDGWKFYLIDNPEIKDRMYVYEKGLRDVLNLMSKNKKKVILVLDNPELTFNPRSCANVRPLRSGGYLSSRCDIPRSEFDKRQNSYRKMVFAVLKDYPQVTAFDSANYLCDQSSCFAKINNAVLYSDYDHLSYAGAKLISRELIKLLNGSKEAAPLLEIRR